MDCDFDEEVENKVEDFLSLPITAEPEPVTTEDVSDRLTELIPRKAPAPDGVSNRSNLTTGVRKHFLGRAGQRVSLICILSQEIAEGDGHSNPEAGKGCFPCRQP